MQCLRRATLSVLALALIELNGWSTCRCRTARCPAPCTHWRGVYPTVLTPTYCGGIDTHSLEGQLRYQLHGGVHGLLILGSIGEGHRLSHEERALVITTVVKVANCKVPVVVGIHTCDVNKALEQMRQAKAFGASAVLVKYYGNPRARAADVIAFYTALSDSNLLPIFFYHYPSDTGLCLCPGAIAAILRLANVVGIKESTFNLREVEAHIRLTRELGKSYFSGSALDLTQFMQLGGHGVMCPEAALLPGPTVAAYEAWQLGDQGRARALQKDLYYLAPILRSRPTPPGLARAELMTLFDLKVPVPLAGDPSPAELKYALSLLGVPTPNSTRPPERPMRPCDYRLVERAVERLQRRTDIRLTIPVETKGCIP